MIKEPKYPSVAFCAKHNLCTGCGICADVCPNHAITIKIINNENKPVIDLDKCKNDKGCFKCFSVCAGHGIDLETRHLSLFENNSTNENPTLGRYESCYVGHSCDESIRYHSASGGCVSSFLIFLLEKGMIGGAIVTRFSKDDPFKAEPFLATTKEEILSAKSSKYCPVSMDGMASLVKNAPFQVAIVGLPCHIQGFRKLASVDKVFKEKVFAYLGIFCSSTKDYRAIDTICKKYGIVKKNVKSFAYRDNGCLGSMTVEYKNGKTLEVPYSEYYGKLRSFFKPERCLSCIDHFAKLADISFGDIHVPPYDQDEIGSNSIIVRSKSMNELLKKSIEEKFIEADIIESSEIVRSQVILPYRKKIFNGHRFIEKLLRHPIVTYDQYPTIPIKPKLILMDVFYRIQKIVSKVKGRN